ncbi:hypothetical protein LTR24_004621 [Lithohypha guttulata]|uniref:Zinc finger protein n=1 Tax=Lithohypha guttulata TaxID=1690604 RepID=A0ABR0KDC1_9EURO|nr:hypothetical protein LTR24_004621 [Lithohypha guttulata]
MFESPASPDDISDQDYSDDDNSTLWRELGFSNIPDWVRLRSSQDQTHNSPPRRLTKKGNPLPEPGKKFYCSFYLQKGHCAYERQGCKFSHQVPDQDDLELWQAIGFSKVPGWLRSNACEKWDRRSSGQAIANENDWTERQPPGGPDSQLMDISPPPLRRDSRRTNCYRPSKHDEFSRDTDVALRSGLRTSDDRRNSSNDHQDRTSAGMARVMDNVGSSISTDRIDLKGAQSEELRMIEPYEVSYKRTLQGIFVSLGLGGEIKYREEKEPRPFVVGVYLYDGPYEQRVGTGISYSSRLLAEEAAAEVALRHPLLDATKSRKATSDGETSKQRQRNVSGDMSGPGITDEYERDADHSVGQTAPNGKPMVLSAASDDREDAFGINIRGLASKASNADKPGSAQEQGANQPPEVTVSAEATRHKTLDVTNLPKAAGFNYLAALYPSEECLLAAGPRMTRTLSPHDGKRASNTPLSDLTTSSRSSHLRKKCSYCKKPESNFQSLVPCTTCPRKYHNICGDPRPDKVSNGSFVCGRCLEKQKARSSNIGIAPSVTAPSEHARLAASVPSYDASTVHQSLQPRPQFHTFPGEHTIVDILNAAGPTELDSRNTGTDLDTSDMLSLRDDGLLAGQTDSIEPTKRPESLPATSASISKPPEDYSPGSTHSTGQVNEAITQASIGCEADDARAPNSYRPQLAAGGIVPTTGPGRSTDSIQAPRATRIRVSDLYDDSHEENDLGQLPSNDDIGNVLDAPRAPKAMRGPAPNPRDDSNVREHHDQSLFDDDKENMPVHASWHRSSMGLETSHLIYNPLIEAAAQKVAVQYKNVTCPWWQAGDTCKRPEDECMFSHRHTGIESPNGNNRAKHWTCPKWRSDEGCPWNAEQCLYAHADTGYYVGPDGKARKKHLTCYWFYHRGKCNKHWEACLFAHRWTGQLAEEPAKKSSRRPEGSDSWTAASGAFSMPQATIISVHKNGLYRPKQVQSLAQIETPAFTNPSERCSLRAVQDTTSNTKETDDKTAYSSTSEAQNKPQASADPRTRGKNHMFVYLQQPVDGERIIESAKEDLPMSVPTTTSPTATSRSQESGRRSSAGGSVKNCTFCGKKVIGRDVCVSCQKSSQGPGDGSPSRATVRPTSSKAGQPEAPELLADIDVDIQETLGNVEHKDVDQVSRSTCKVLKRSASGSGLFAPNKRTRPNPPTVPSKTTRPNAAPPSIEEVIATERAKKEQHYTVKASAVGEPVTRRRTLLSSDLASPDLALDRAVVSGPTSAARSPTVSDIIVCTEGLAGKQAMNEIRPTSVDEMELSNSEVQQAPPIRLHDEDDDLLEDIEYSVTESMAEKPRSEDTIAKRPGDASSDEESEISLLQRFRQYNESTGTKSGRDMLWSSSTITSQGTTADQPVTVPAPKRLPNGRYNCPFTCGQTFSDAKGATRHAIDLHVNAVNHQCEFCGKGYYRKDKYRAHIDSCSGRDATQNAQSHRNILVVEEEQKEPRKEIPAVSQSSQRTRGGNPLHEEAANYTMPSTFTQTSKPVTRIEPEPEWEDRNDGDEESTSPTIPSISSPRAVKVEAYVHDKTVNPSAVAAQFIESDEDETNSEDSNSSEDKSEQVCKICPRPKTVGECLHSVSGSLDGKKCDNYISERVARNIQQFPADTHGRLMAIENAALESRRAWQNVGRAENLKKTKEDVTILPEALKMFDLGPAMSKDCERSLVIHNHSSSHIMFKAQIHYGPCEQEWELRPNWGEIGRHSMLSVCARRKISSTPISYGKLGPLPVQYPEYVTVSYVPLTSDDDTSRMEEWEIAEEQGVVPIKTIRVPIEYTRKSPLPNSAEGGSMIGEAVQDELNYDDRDDRDELTLSEVETPRAVKKIRLKPIVQIPPRKPAKKSQPQDALKLTLKFPANTQRMPTLSPQQQTQAHTTAADKSRDPSTTNPRETQATVTSNKELGATSKAGTVKINLRVGPPPMGSSASGTLQTRAQHRRTASEADRIENSPPLKTLQAAGVSSRAEEASGTFQQINVEGPKPLRRTFFDQTGEILGPKDTERPAEAMPHHAVDANSILDRNNKLPQKGRPRTSLRATRSSFERSLPDYAKKLTKAKRKEPPAELYTAIARLKARGVKFEDPDTDDEVENDNDDPQFTKPQSTSARTHPPPEPLQSFLFTHDKHSLYYKPENSVLPPPPEASLPLPKIMKGQGMKQPKLIRHRQMLRNLWLHGNAHKECNRHSPKQEVYAMVERKIPDPHDRYAPDVLQVREEKITFREFCGLKRDAEYEPCLIGSGEGARLAFREKEDGKFGSGVGVGNGRRKRVADGEKWPVSER